MQAPSPLPSQYSLASGTGDGTGFTSSGGQGFTSGGQDNPLGQNLANDTPQFTMGQSAPSYSLSSGNGSGQGLSLNGGLSLNYQGVSAQGSLGNSAPVAADEDTVDNWSNQAMGAGENPNAPESNQTLVTVGRGDTVEGLAKQVYGDQWRAGMALMISDNSLKANQWGSPIIQPGQSLVANDLSQYDDDSIALLSKAGGNVEVANSQGLSARAALIAQQQQLAAQDQAYTTYMAMGGRSSETTGPVSIHTGGTPMTVPVYDAMGNFTGMQTDVDDSPPTMSYGDQMAHVGQVVIGVAKGVVDGVPKMVMGAASILWQGAQMEGLTEAGVDPQTAYGIASQSTKDWSNGEILPYSNSDQRLGGYAGELLSPGAYGKGLQLAAVGVSTLGPAFEAAAYNIVQRSGGVLNVVQDTGVSGATGAASATESAPGLSQVQINSQNGAAFQARVAAYGNDTLDNFLEEVSIRPYTDANGTTASFRVRLDGLGTDTENAGYGLLDAKASKTAPLTPNQTVGYPLLEQYGGVVAGKAGKPYYPAGTVIPPTQVQIIRPIDLPEGY